MPMPPDHPLLPADEELSLLAAQAYHAYWASYAVAVNIGRGPCPFVDLAAPVQSAWRAAALAVCDPRPQA